MQSSLIESPDEHHWVLLDHRVTQLAVDTGALRIQSWALDGSTELRVAAPFTLRGAGGAGRTLDPVETLTLGPALALLRRRLASVTITRDGELTADFGDGVALVVGPDRRIDAWELQGGGALEGMAYRCPPGGGLW
ncbi:MAG TPA: DUF6188 family protein [Gemmatimonadaceae bacterium]